MMAHTSGGFAGDGTPLFRHTYQSGLLSILYSLGTDPLQIWSKRVQDGHIKRLRDEDIESPVIELTSKNIRNTQIACPPSRQWQLGIKLPFLVLLIKNMKCFISFEFEILDAKNIIRRFRASNFQYKARVSDLVTTVHLRLEDGWNQVTVNMNDLCRRAYDRLYTEDELPAEFKLYLPVQETSGEDDQGEKQPAESPQTDPKDVKTKLSASVVHNVGTPYIAHSGGKSLQDSNQLSRMDAAGAKAKQTKVSDDLKAGGAAKRDVTATNSSGSTPSVPGRFQIKFMRPE